MKLLKNNSKVKDQMHHNDNSEQEEKGLNLRRYIPVSVVYKVNRTRSTLISFTSG